MARTAGPVATPPAVSDSTQPGKIPDLVAELQRLRARVAGHGDRARGGTEETFLSVSAFSTPGWWAPLVFARMGRFARSACWAAQGSDHGNSDQPREYVGPEFAPIQSVGLTERSVQCFPVACRVTLWGTRGVRVGEAKSPGPEDRPNGGATQRDSGADFSHSRRSGLTESGSQVVNAMEFDLTHGDSATETDTVSVWSELNGSRDAPRLRRLRLVWNTEDTPQWPREARGAERPVRELAGRIGCVPRDVPLPRAIRQQRWRTLKRPTYLESAGNPESVSVSVGSRRCVGESRSH